MIGAFVDLVAGHDDLTYAIEVGRQSRRWDALDTYAARMASIAVRERDSDMLRRGLVAALIAMKSTDDEREALPTLSLLYRAWEILDDRGLCFRAPRDLQVREEDDPFVAFARRSPDDRGIRAMGYREGSDSEGFRFLDQ
ncbi:hypothetical protein B4N89_12085 [Embleya scabrispora]|uniref:Uncharacterized protein n=1 Tax=Embleya scabrispora TaxID=159449 RepID=A0A1T3NXM4_9ACTN|nr:hypothetical protein B4N89_12085 [Embleya scabrispora]